MADTLCGPANPLQQFKSQTQLDRTLQQDRLTSRLSPSHGFRSADPNTGLLDPEFEAFQNGLSPQDLPTYYPTYQQPPQQPAFAGPSQAQSSWASDFQHMSIASQQRPQQAPANTASASSAWSQGFKEQYSQFGPRQQSSAPSPLAFQQRARYGGLQSNFARPAYASGMTQTKGKEAVVDQFDEAAFERAFEQANESIAKEAEQVESADLVQLYEDEVAAARSDLLQNKQLESQQQNQVQQQREDDDALAATAQDLLSKVENNQTDKFRNSQFLSLMRKLRDREVKVEGDQMVTTATSEPATSVPYDSLSEDSISVPVFNNSEQRPAPLGGAAVSRAPAVVDTRPFDHGLPLDSNLIRAEDGQDVVDLLSQPGALSGNGEDIGMYDASTVDFVGDVSASGGGESGSLSEMLYGADGTLGNPVEWRRSGVGLMR